MTPQKCSKCETDFVLRNGSYVCPNCGESQDNSQSRFPSSANLDVTIDRQVDAQVSDRDSSDFSHYSISLPSIPARAGEGKGEPEGLRDRKVDDQGSIGTDGESPEFRLIKELDQGAFGKVFRSMQVSLGRQVAVKVLKERFHSQPDIRTDFFKEAQITGRLEHPNVVPVHDIGVAAGGNEAGSPFYVMKEIKGTSWDQVIREKTREENVDILRRVMDAIKFAHSKNILHCDLKPKNVMLGEYGEVLVVDWGHAIDTKRPDSFRPGGTLAYMSPEMAGFYMDRGSTESFAHLKWNIGPRSDVYLLGGILFEIITGRYPHVDPEADSKPDPQDDSKRIYPSDQNLKSWALENRICDYSDYAEDELLQIALRALRKTEGEILTVEQFQDALKIYQDHRRSIEIRSRAFTWLEEAKRTSSYDTFQKAKLGFEESLDLWNENSLAQEGLRETRLRCAEVALGEQNFDLGIGMLEKAESKAELRVKHNLQAGKRKRDRRKRVVGFLSVAFATSIVVGVVVSMGMFIYAKTTVAEAEIKAEETIADANSKAEAVTRKALSAKADAEWDTLYAKWDTFVAKWNTYLARRSSIQATAEKREAVKDGKKAKTEKDEALQIAGRAQYRTEILEIEQTILSGDFKGAESMLDQLRDKSLPEWKRLNLLSCRELERYSLKELKAPLKDAKLSGDRSKLVLVFADKIEVRSTADLSKVILTLDFSEVECIAVSHSGSQLALAQQGKINIVPAEPLSLSQARFTLDNVQTDSIFDMAFSRDGKSLVSVGRPDPILKSAALEHELMVWEFNRGQWDSLASTKFSGSTFTPTVGQFSDDGKRILAFNDSGDLGPHPVIVLERSNASQKPRYELIATADSNFGYSVFGDAQGTKVISSVVEELDHRVIVWPVNDPAQRLAGSKSIDSKIARLDFREKAVLAVNEKNESLVWQLRESGFVDLDKDPRVFRGHREAIGRAGTTQDNTKLISVSINDSTIIKTDMETYADSVFNLSPDPRGLNGESTATVFFENHPAKRAIIGNDQGLVSIHDLSNRDSELVCSWETDAWERHIVTNNYLFAISKRDLLYRYDLVTGELQGVVTQLSEVMSSEEIEPDQSGKISTLEISRDGRFAVLQRNNGKLEFEIWNLETAARVKTVEIDKSQPKFQSLNAKTIPNLVISHDGKWIAGGKVSVFVWQNNGTEVGKVGNEQQLEGSADSIRFFADTSKLVISYKERLKLYKLGRSNEPEGIYRIENLPNANGLPNLVDATVFNGANYLLIRRLVEKNLTMELLELTPGRRARVVQSFPQATHGSFHKDKALVVTRDSSKPIIVLELIEKLGKPRDVSGRYPQQVASQLGGRSASTRKRFSRVHMNENEQLVLNWQVRGKHNTVCVKENGQVGALVVTATPRLQSAAIGADFAVTLNNSKLRLWGVSTGEERFISPKKTFDGNYRLAEISPDLTKAFIVDSRSEAAEIMQLGNGLEKRELENINAAQINSAAWSNDSLTLAIGLTNGQVRIGDDVVFSPNLADVDSSIQSFSQQLKFSGDGKSLMVVQNTSGDWGSQSGGANAFTLRKLEDGAWKVSTRFKHADQDPIQCADISANGSRVLTGSSRGRITIWDSATATLSNSDEQVEDGATDSTVDAKGEQELTGRELLTIGRRLTAVQAVGFLQEESAVIALEAQSSTAIVFPFAK